MQQSATVLVDCCGFWLSMMDQSTPRVASCTLSYLVTVFQWRPFFGWVEGLSSNVYKMGIILRWLILVPKVLGLQNWGCSCMAIVCHLWHSCLCQAHGNITILSNAIIFRVFYLDQGGEPANRKFCGNSNKFMLQKVIALQCVNIFNSAEITPALLQMCGLC